MSKDVNKTVQPQFQRGKRIRFTGGMLSLVFLASAATIHAGSGLPNPIFTRDASGILSTYSTSGSVDLANPFFQNLGSNGRSCGSCHQPADAWTVAPPHIQQRFYASGGTDPIFRTVDGANCPSADVSTFAARRSAYSLLLTKGLIRVSLAVPSTADFTIQNIQDPYNCAETTTGKPAEYRRPLPSTNLGFLATVMWDGRETVKGQAMSANLSQQAIDATLGHAEATSAPTADQVSQIVALETAMYTAQAFDNNAKSLTSGGAKGGPVSLSSRPFHIGINDVLGQDPAGTAFTPVVFDEFSSWSKAREDSSDARRSVTHAGKLCSTHCPSPLPASRG